MWLLSDWMLADCDITLNSVNSDQFISFILKLGLQINDYPIDISCFYSLMIVGSSHCVAVFYDKYISTKKGIKFNNTLVSGVYALLR